MLRKMMLTGLMTATLLSGIAPAYAQSDPGERGNRGERAGRSEGRSEGRFEGRSPASRGNPMMQPRGDVQAQRPQQPQVQPQVQPRNDGSTQRWQQRGADRPTGGMAPPRPDPRWRGDPSLPANRAVENGVRDRREPQQNWRNDQRDDRQQGRNERRDDQRDWRNDRRDGRQDGRNDRQDWRGDRRDDRGWNDNRGNNGANWNNGRRYDDRTRWSNQRRWDNGWRNDRRYDWNSYRNRYGDRYRIGRYAAPRGWDYGYRRFSVGIFLNNMLYSNNYWLDDPYAYRLPPAYGSMRWVRYYDDAMLVDIRDGYVVDVIHGFFW